MFISRICDAALVPNLCIIICSFSNTITVIVLQHCKILPKIKTVSQTLQPETPKQANEKLDAQKYSSKIFLRILATLFLKFVIYI